MVDSLDVDGFCVFVDVSAVVSMGLCCCVLSMVMVTNGVCWCRRSSAIGRSLNNDVRSSGDDRLRIRFRLVLLRSWLLVSLLGFIFAIDSSSFSDACGA